MKYRSFTPCALLFVGVNFFPTPAYAQNYNAALNTTNLIWTSSGTGSGEDWSIESSTSLDGSAVESSRVSSSGSTSTLETTVTGPGTLSFWWFTPMIDEEDALTFNINGVAEASVVGTTYSWEQQTFYLGTGSQTLQWVYSQAIPPGDSSSGYLDEVRYVAGAVAPIFTNAPTSQSQIEGVNNTFYAGAEGTPPLSYQWQFNNTNIPGATSSSYTVTDVQAASLGSYSVIVTNSAGTNHSTNAALSFGDLTAWGWPVYGETAVPPAATNVIAISGGFQCSLALKSDGTVISWGPNTNAGQSIPPNLTNVVAVKAGAINSMVLKADGTVNEWGDNTYNQTNFAAGLTNVVAIALPNYGGDHSVALKSDGTVVAWGYNGMGQTSVPATLSNAIAVAAGDSYSLALRSDGTVIGWGDNSFGEITIPPNLSNVVAIATGAEHSLALKSDGTVVPWGLNANNATNVPAQLTNVVAIAAGLFDSVALQANSVVMSWGYNRLGETNVPAGLTNVIAISSGATFNMALAGQGPSVFSPLTLTNPILSSNGFSVTLPSQSGRVYALEYKTSLTDSTWTALPLVAGTGSNLTMTDPNPSDTGRFYRIGHW